MSALPLRHLVPLCLLPLWIFSGGCSSETEPAVQPTLVQADTASLKDTVAAPDEGEPFTPPARASCGDGVCMGEETKADCCMDCGCGAGFACTDNQCQTAPSCGDGTCQPGLGENCSNCIGDCACASGDTCTGSGVCCTPQCSIAVCGADACGGSCGDCSNGSACDGGQCVSPNVCGDGFCDTGDGQKTENCSTCHADCACDDGPKSICLADGTCCDPTCSGKHCGNDGCGGSCGTCPDGGECSADNTCR